MNNGLFQFRALITLILISLSFFGTNCNNTTTQVTNANIQGNWKLVSNTGGNLKDICPGENADFQSNGVAVLTCPNQQSINRNYSVSNSVLSFPETGVQYSVNLTNNSNTLNMNGMGSVSGRILVYNKITSSSEIPNSVPSSSEHKNSSEK